MSADTTSTRPTPRAFVSYSWDSDEHKQWVLEFATRLRNDGVEVTLDQWHLHPGDQLPAFMERAIRDKEANTKLEEADAQAFAREERDRQRREERERNLRDTAKRITFD